MIKQHPPRRCPHAHEGRVPFPGGVMFVYGSKSLREPFFPPKLLPQIDGEHCAGVAVARDDTTPATGLPARATATVDRLTGVIRVEWTGPSGDPVRCSPYSMLGELLYRTTTPPGATSASIPRSALVAGLILVSIESPSSYPAVTFVVN